MDLQVRVKFFFSNAENNWLEVVGTKPRGGIKGSLLASGESEVSL